MFIVIKIFMKSGLRYTLCNFLKQKFVNSSPHILLLEHYGRWYCRSSYSWISILLTNFYDKTCSIKLFVASPMHTPFSILSQKSHCWVKDYSFMPLNCPWEKLYQWNTTRSLFSWWFSRYLLMTCGPLTISELELSLFYMFFWHSRVSWMLCLFLLRN